MEKGIMYMLVMWAAAALFLGMGIYISRRKEPMRIWTTERISADMIRDVPAYNKAVGKMWGFVSIPLCISGVIELWYPIASVIFFCIFCIIGIPGFVWCAHKIEEKYKVN